MGLTCGAWRGKNRGCVVVAGVRGVCAGVGVCVVAREKSEVRVDME